MSISACRSRALFLRWRCLQRRLQQVRAARDGQPPRTRLSEAMHDGPLHGEIAPSRCVRTSARARTDSFPICGARRIAESTAHVAVGVPVVSATCAAAPSKQACDAWLRPRRTRLEPRARASAKGLRCLRPRDPDLLRLQRPPSPSPQLSAALPLP
eukprot:4282761-Pleurochrysis_carterae.AAC.4